MNSSLQVLLLETGFTVRYVMVNIVEAATTISPPRRTAFADNCDGHYWQHVFLSFLKWMKHVNLEIDAPFSDDIVSLIQFRADMSGLIHLTPQTKTSCIRT